MLNMIDKVLSTILIILMAAMVLDVTWQIGTRFLTDSPSSWTEEVARFLLVWIGLLGAAWAYRKRAHLGLSYLVEKASPENQRKLAIFSSLATVFFAVVVMILGGFYLMSLMLELKQTSASLGIPIGWVYSVLPLSGLLIAIYGLDQARRYASGEVVSHPHLEDESGV